MSQALRKLAAAIGKTGTAVLFINQLREKVGIVFGNPEVTPGGRALKFYSSVRIELRRSETIKQGDEIIGNRVKARVVKNKVAPPFRTAEFDIMFDHGISLEGAVIDLGTELGLVSKSGAFFSYGDVRLGQGRENTRQFLREHPEIAQEIEQRIRASANAPSASESE
jgi:recombination protein RecA